MATPQPPLQQKNQRLGRGLALLVVVMVGFAFAAVPLYRVFCQATGVGGGTKRATALPAKTPVEKGLPRTITVRFNADVAPGLAWDFKPKITHMVVKIGEAQDVSFYAKNNGKEAITGVAVHNVQPEGAGLYFNKTQCFCFDDHTLKPGEESDLPVQFFIDPAFLKDHEMDDVNTITLSYTFFPAKSPLLSAAKKKQEEEQQHLLEAAKKIKD